MSLKENLIRIADEKERKKTTTQRQAMKTFQDSRISSKRNLFCPHCGKLLTRVSEDARGGSIFPFCKRCKKEVEVPLER